MWNLIRLAPLILGEHVEIDNGCGNLFILFCQLTERLCALKFSKSDLIILMKSFTQFFLNICQNFQVPLLNLKHISFNITPK